MAKHDYHLRDLSRIATAGWPPALPMELALGVMEPLELKEHYGIDDATWASLPGNEAFIKAFQACVERLKEEGMGFRARAQLIAEGNLEVAQRMIADANAPATVRKDLLVAMARWAGYDQKAPIGDEGNARPGTALQIVLNLAGDEPKRIAKAQVIEG